MLHQEFAGLPWSETESLLQKTGLSYEVKQTRPTRDYFETDERKLYVVRARQGTEGIWEIVLAARMRSAADDS